MTRLVVKQLPPPQQQPQSASREGVAGGQHGGGAAGGDRARGRNTSHVNTASSYQRVHPFPLPSAYNSFTDADAPHCSFEAGAMGGERSPSQAAGAAEYCPQAGLGRIESENSEAGRSDFSRDGDKTGYNSADEYENKEGGEKEKGNEDDLLREKQFEVCSITSFLACLLHVLRCMSLPVRREF